MGHGVPTGGRLCPWGAKHLPRSSPFTALENVEGSPPPGSQAVEDLQQEINAQSLEKVQQYYRKLRYRRGSHVGARILDAVTWRGPLRGRHQSAPSARADTVLFLEHLLCVSPSAYTRSSDSHSRCLSNPFYR